MPVETIDEYMIHDPRLFYCESYKQFTKDPRKNKKPDDKKDESNSHYLSSNYRGQMRVSEDGRCIKHGFGQVMTTHIDDIKEYDGKRIRYYEEITTKTIYIGYWEDDKRSGLGKQYKKTEYKK